MPAGTASAALGWYADVLGWPVRTGPPAELETGTRFDVLDLPAEAGRAVLRRAGLAGPVARAAGRTHFFVAAGSADELPGLLDWLEWGGVELDLRGVGSGGRVAAPVPPGMPVRAPGAAFWLRPPGPPGEGRSALPALAGFGSRGGGAPDLVRLVDAAATECHRARLAGARERQRPAREPASQPLAFS